VLVTLSISVREAWLLFGLFWAQFLIGGLVPESVAGIERGPGRRDLPGARARDLRAATGLIRPLIRDGFRHVLSGHEPRGGLGSSGGAPRPRHVRERRRYHRRVDPRAFLESLHAEDELVHVRELPARTNEPGPVPPDVPELVAQRLALVGVTGLYEHQREALELARSGRNVIVATGTASGKTLVYNSRSRARRSPTQADRAVPVPHQGRSRATSSGRFASSSCRRSGRRLRRRHAQDRRPLIRKNANLVMTNPDMLHAGILPDPRTVGRLPARLSLVVVDETHVFRACSARTSRMCSGGFGAWSRTTAEPSVRPGVGHRRQPGRAGERLIGEPFEAVTADRSPSGGKTFALWNPPIVDEESGARRARSRTRRS
jgi:DEAD/DEAH box helicase domain-containing protein